MAEDGDGAGDDVGGEGGDGCAAQPYRPVLQGVGSEVPGVSQNADKGDLACVLYSG